MKPPQKKHIYSYLPNTAASAVEKMAFAPRSPWLVIRETRRATLFSAMQVDDCVVPRESCLCPFHDPKLQLQRLCFSVPFAAHLAWFFTLHAPLLFASSHSSCKAPGFGAPAVTGAAVTVECYCCKSDNLAGRKVITGVRAVRTVVDL